MDSNRNQTFSFSQLLTVKDVATLYNRSEEAIYQRLHRKKPFPGVTKFGGSIRFYKHLLVSKEKLFNKMERG